MKNAWLIQVILICISCGGNRAKPMDAGLLTEAEVKDFVLAYDKAWERRDTIAMKELMDEKYIYFSSTGSTTGRSNIIGWFTTADKYKVDTAYRDQVNIIINGNTAIVNSHWVGHGSFGTEKFDDDQRCGLVIQKLNGKLKIISENCVQIVK